MVDSKGNSVRHLDILRMVLFILGCLLFLGSSIFPFLHEIRAASIIPEDSDRTSYWSLKCSTQQVRSLFPYQTVEYWFYDYWVKEYAYRSELPLVFVFMLAAQILTLITGIASVFLKKRLLALAPAILCPMVTALMVYVSTSFRSWEISYQQGYWLTYPSMLFFIAAFTLSLVIHKKQTKLTQSFLNPKQQNYDEKRLGLPEILIENLRIWYKFLLFLLHFVVEIFKPLKKGWIVIFFPHTFYKRFHLLPCSRNGKKLIN